jgi:hypothetical protein
MVELLTWSTVAYAVILVLALATGLIAIALYLNRARAHLEGIAEGLAVADQQTAPIEGVLVQADNGLVAVRDNLQKVAENLGALTPEVAGGTR